MRAFLLSPARAGGVRMQLLFNPRAGFELAHRFQREGAPLGELFQFASGLYFRGKLAYSRAFAAAPGLVLVIVPGRGLLDERALITPDELRAVAAVPLDAGEPRYRAPLERDVRALADRLGPAGQVVLLGSVATGKYADVLLGLLGERLLFPQAFVGRGDMSRGGLLLRCVRAGEELEYQQLAGAVRHGKRPPRLAREQG